MERQATTEEVVTSSDTINSLTSLTNPWRMNYNKIQTTFNSNAKVLIYITHNVVGIFLYSSYILSVLLCFFHYHQTSNYHECFPSIFYVHTTNFTPDFSFHYMAIFSSHMIIIFRSDY